MKKNKIIGSSIDITSAAGSKGLFEETINNKQNTSKLQD